MRKRTTVWGLAMAVVLAAGLANAQATGSSVAPHWTVDSAQTVGDGANVLRGQVGWPGLWLDFIHGVDPTFDLGGRFALNWGGFDGALNNCYSVFGFGGCTGTNIGLSVQLLLRKQLTEIGGFKLALTFDPGFLLVFPPGTTNFGIAFPIGAQMGFPVDDKLTFNASFELPFYITFGSNGGPTIFYIPLLFGGGVEYMLQQDLLLTFKLAMGPSIPTCSNCSTAFALEGLAGVAYKLK
jgi:hypothetical protein